MSVSLSRFWCPLCVRRVLDGSFPPAVHFGDPTRVSGRASAYRSIGSGCGQLFGWCVMRRWGWVSGGLQAGLPLCRHARMVSCRRSRVCGRSSDALLQWSRSGMWVLGCVLKGRGVGEALAFRECVDQFNNSCVSARHAQAVKNPVGGRRTPHSRGFGPWFVSSVRGSFCRGSLPRGSAAAWM